MDARRLRAEGSRARLAGRHATACEGWGRRRGPRICPVRDQFPAAPACIAAMLDRITAWISRNSFGGLNCTHSVPGAFWIGTWPGGR